MWSQTEHTFRGVAWKVTSDSPELVDTQWSLVDVHSREVGYSRDEEVWCCRVGVARRDKGRGLRGTVYRKTEFGDIHWLEKRDEGACGTK